ncbi:hypothetical protein GCM10010246_06410 [Streptomyces cuspidosporus]|uniref:Uncharacterized protein n=1 Tax=Streptomyces cuspidosporus TaxID=66882 RepID=A0ABN3FDM3_9ACTN
MFSEIHEAAPGADTVLVGYPRIVPEDTSACLEPIPGGTEKPLASDCRCRGTSTRTAPAVICRPNWSRRQSSTSRPPDLGQVRTGGGSGLAGSLTRPQVVLGARSTAVGRAPPGSPLRRLW